MSFLQSHKLLYKGMELETMSAIDRMTVKPSAIDAINYNDWIKEIKVGHGLPLGVNNLSTTFRLLQMSACHHPQVAQLNWAMTGTDGWVSNSSSNPAIVGGSLSHIPYKATGSNGFSYLAFPPGVFSTAIQYNCSYGNYAYNDPNEQWGWGSGQTNGNYNFSLFRDAATATRGRIHCICNITANIAYGTTGLWVYKRNGTAGTLNINGVQRGTGVMNDIGVLNLHLGIHGIVRNGDVINLTQGIRQSCHFHGVFGINVAVMKTAIENYMAKYP